MVKKVIERCDLCYFTSATKEEVFCHIRDEHNSKLKDIGKVGKPSRLTPEGMELYRRMTYGEKK